MRKSIITTCVTLILISQISIQAASAETLDCLWTDMSLCIDLKEAHSTYISEIKKEHNINESLLRKIDTIFRPIADDEDKIAKINLKIEQVQKRLWNSKKERRISALLDYVIYRLMEYPFYLEQVQYDSPDEIKDEFLNDETYKAPVLIDGDIIAVIETNIGTIKLKLYNTSVPKTALNFIWLWEQGYYKDVIFHRVIKDFMIQWGDPDGLGFGWESLYGENFEDEFDPRLTNIRGTISMANSWPDTNGSQFFINVVDNNFLDNKHPVFGQVVEWMDIVDKISRIKVDTRDRPVVEIKMIDVNIQTYNNGKYVDYDFNLETELNKLEKVLADRDAVRERKLEAKARADKGRIATEQDKVVVHYKGILEDGTIFDSSYERDNPIEVDLSMNQVILGFKQGIIGMKIGDKKSIVLEPTEAYGEYDVTKTQEFPLADLKAQWMTPVEWEYLQSVMWKLKILKVTEDTVTLDVNHPLAGESLNFEIEFIKFVN